MTDYIILIKLLQSKIEFLFIVLIFTFNILKG